MAEALSKAVQWLLEALRGVNGNSNKLKFLNQRGRGFQHNSFPDFFKLHPIQIIILLQFLLLWENPAATSLDSHVGGQILPIPPQRFTQTSHGRSFCYPMCFHTNVNIDSYKLSSWFWPGNFAWLSSSFCFVLVLWYLLNQYASNIFCHTKGLAVRKRETEKFFPVVQIYHVLGAHLALQKRSYKFRKMVMKYSLEML